MGDGGGLLNLFLDNFRKLFYPEEWIKLDLAVSKTELFVLLMLGREREIIMSQIADYINVPLSTATGIVDRLVNKGYLKRERSDSDRRIVVIRLTEKGRTLTDSVKESMTSYLGRIEEALTEEERELLYKLIFKVIDILNTENLTKTSDDGEAAAGTKKIKKITIE